MSFLKNLFRKSPATADHLREQVINGARFIGKDGSTYTRTFGGRLVSVDQRYVAGGVHDWHGGVWIYVETPVSRDFKFFKNLHAAGAAWTNIRDQVLAFIESDPTCGGLGPGPKYGPS